MGRVKARIKNQSKKGQRKEYFPFYLGRKEKSKKEEYLVWINKRGVDMQVDTKSGSLLVSWNKKVQSREEEEKEKQQRALGTLYLE